MPSRPATTALACLTLGLLLAGLALEARQAERGRLSPAHSLHLQWVRDLPPPRPAWPDQTRLQFDAAFRPVLHADLVLLGSSHTDSLTALDAATGQERWRFRAEGPVRFAPAVWEDRVYVTSDDGWLYCLDIHRGRLLWKFRGGPSDRKVLGNERLISTWPARGAPVVVAENGQPGDPRRPAHHASEATVYFAAGIWPFMGIFLHALDARSGEILWKNSGDGSMYIKQPHQADAFAGVAPQGQLVVVGDKLLVPGRSAPACYHRATGRLIHYRLADASKLGGGADVHANGQLFVNGGGAFDLDTGDYLGAVGDPAVLTAEVLVAVAGGELRALDARRSGRKPRPADRKLPPAGLAKRAGVAAPGVEALAVGGDWLYVGTARQVFATPLPLQNGRLPRVWQVDIEGTPGWLAADDERLVVSTREGRVYCFGERYVPPRKHPWKPTPPEPVEDDWGERAEKLLRDSGVRDGYCIAWGVGTGRLITELALRSRLHVIAVEPDAQRAAAVRGDLEAAGLYGSRVSILTSSSSRLTLPPYLATLMVSEDLAQAGIDADDGFLRQAFGSLRPYGGTACLSLPPGGQAPDLSGWANDNDLAQARVRHEGDDLWLVRAGPLPGAADWTHEHGDAANTRTAHDKRVKAPLGLLWFGGPGNQGVLPRHGHGPQPQVVAGRLILEGVDMLRALDVYTGRLLWEAPLPGVGKVYDVMPHQPGANSTGSNFVATPQGVYVAHGIACRCLDPATGREVAAFRMPVLPGEREPPVWDFMTVAGDFLIGGANPRDPALKGKAPPPPAASRHLVVLDRVSGRLLWTRPAAIGFRHNALCVGNGRLFVTDRLAPTLPSWLQKPSAKSSEPPRLLALDLRTGKEVWGTTRAVFGTWLSYSADRDVLVESGRVARDGLSDEPKGMRAYRGSDGRELWYRPEYLGPAMILGDRVLRTGSAAGGNSQAGCACDLLTGAPTLRPDPLTGQLVEWTWSRNYGCNTPLASENLLTFRSGAAGYYDLCNDGGTGNIGGFRSGCTNNLIVADGVLSAADYTRQCTCSYQNQTSLALVHEPDAEMWTFYGSQKVDGVVRRAGVNLGAPGNRRADDGTLWLEYPAVGGPSPRLGVRATPTPLRWFRLHSSQVDGDGPAWVTASGARGLRELTIPLAPTTGKQRRYTVRLYFLEPDDLPAGRRRFDVALQGRSLLRDLDVSDEAGGPHRGLVKEFHGVLVGSELTVKLTPDDTAAVPETVLCGVEAVAEGW